MKLRLRYARLLWLAVIVCALVPGQAAGATDPVPLKAVTGSDRRFGVAEAFRTQQTDLAWNAGVKWQRLTMSWPGLDPGYWNGEWYLPLSYLDTQISHDIDLVGMLIGTPPRYAADPAKGPQSVPAGLYLPYNHPDNSWARYVRQAATYYKGRIFHWIIWNEPDITPADPNAAYYTWAGSVADYYQLLKTAYLVIKDVDPTLTVGTAGLTYWTDKHAGRRQYFDRLLDEVAADPTAPAHNHYMDFVSLHLYSDPHGLYEVPQLFRQFMAARGMDKPIWVPETNVIPYDDPVNAGGPLSTPADMRATLSDQASFVIQAFALALAAGVQRIEIYKMKDGDNDIINGQALIADLPGLRPRPAYVAFQVATQYFSRSRASGYFRSGDVEQVVIDREGQRVTVLWNGAAAAAQVPIRRSGDGAKLLDKYGVERPLTAAGDGYLIALDPATAFTNPDAPGQALIGGSPVLLVETGISSPLRSSFA